MPVAERNEKERFKSLLKDFAETLTEYVSAENGEWSVKGFIDANGYIHTLSADTKMLSKVFEIHLWPKLRDFAQENSYVLEPASQQNYYPDFSFIHEEDKAVKFAVDIKTTYRLLGKAGYCNGFTLGSHGTYFKNRTSTQYIQYPYGEYLGHFCLGAIYSRAEAATGSRVLHLSELGTISSAIKDIVFFACEKWEIASDTEGSGNTKNIGSIKKISDILEGNGLFKVRGLDETCFDDYWTHYGDLIIHNEDASSKTIKNLDDFLEYREKNPLPGNTSSGSNHSTGEGGGNA